MVKQQNNGTGKSINKLPVKNKPLHELSETEKEHLTRSGLYIPPVKLTSWQKLQTFFASVPDSVKNVLSFKTLSQAVNASVLIGAITFIAGEQQRRDLQVYQAWQVISAAHGQAGSGGRVQALEFLNSQPRRIPWFWLYWDRENLAGLEAQSAYLVPSRKDTLEKGGGIKLSDADLESANLQWAYLAHANLQWAYLKNAHLQNATLWRANLQGADLGRANLQGANLGIANLKGANLSKANLQGANLGSANLQDAHLENTNMQKAIYTNESTSREKCKYYLKDYPCPTIFPPNFDPKAAGMVLVLKNED